MKDNEKTERHAKVIFIENHTMEHQHSPHTHTLKFGSFWTELGKPCGCTIPQPLSVWGVLASSQHGITLKGLVPIKVSLKVSSGTYKKTLEKKGKEKTEAAGRGSYLPQTFPGKVARRKYFPRLLTLEEIIF